MKILLETERTYLREFIPEDAIHFFQMNKDPEVIEFTGDAPFKNIEEAELFLQNYDAYKKTGVGRYAVLRKSDHVFLGWSGLRFNHLERQVDLGYRFYRYYWNQGYATETAQAIITYAFKVLKLPFLIGRAHKDHLASQKVLTKCAFSQEKQIVYKNEPTLLYRLKNKNYHLKEIVAEDTWPVRHPVLRAGRPLKDVYMEADEKESTFHLGIYFKNNIVGVASFMEDSYTDFQGKQSRLRGMAVLPEYRKKGLAELLLKRGEDLLKEKGRELLWFNARIIALSFYKNLGYEIIGDKFDIPKVGPHYRMKKNLT